MVTAHTITAPAGGLLSCLLCLSAACCASGCSLSPLVVHANLALPADACRSEVSNCPAPPPMSLWLAPEWGFHSLMSGVCNVTSILPYLRLLCRADAMFLKVNKLSSIKTQLPYDYYSLPYCRPERIVNFAENLGRSQGCPACHISPDLDVHEVPRCYAIYACKASFHELRREPG